ncbi:unnamed protein product [Camellia sinensis]
MAYEIEGVRYEEEFILNSRGMKLFTCRWLPANHEPKALIFLCHGYAMECSISMKGAGTRLAKAGFGVYGMDYEGHGKSSGLQGYVPCFEDLVTDCSDHYTSISERKENMKKLRILLGESMGGAVALLLHRKKPASWDGAVLVAPMCKIADDLRPNPLVIKVLTKLCRVIPTWKIIPTQDIVDVAFRDPEVRKEIVIDQEGNPKETRVFGAIARELRQLNFTRIIRSNSYCYTDKPRLQTGNQLMTVSLDLEQRLNEVSLPFLVVHGGDDKVTDPAVSKLLFETACSKDKTFKLYPGMWHSLTYGELPENIDAVFSDIVAWLDERVAARNAKLEYEQKLENDKFLQGNSSKEVFVVDLFDLEQRLDEVSLPFLVVHGGDDKVTDPAVSKLLFETACSKDKTFKLYPGMWHSLTYGELPENIDAVFSDIVAWLDERVAARNAKLEYEQKLENDKFLQGNSSKEVCGKLVKLQLA